MKRGILPAKTALMTALLMTTAAVQAQSPAPRPAAAAPDAGAGPVVDQTPIVSFPGQYAPRPAGERFAVNPKSCWRLADAAERLACTEFVLADWPRLARFAAANAALTPAKAGVKRVVFFGDSITDNWSKVHFGGFFPGKPYVNRGIGGQTTSQMLVRFRADVIANHPRAVVILAGTNDVSGNTGPTTPEAIQDNLASMIDLAQANGIRVVLASLLPTTDEKKSPNGTPIVRSKERPPEVIRALNAWMAAYARTKRVVYLDYHGALADEAGRFKAELTDDGLHPNAAGYALMGPLAEKAIAAALRR
jgi:lysophospholipase L1-like esterase